MDCFAIGLTVARVGVAKGEFAGGFGFALGRIDRLECAGEAELDDAPFVGFAPVGEEGCALDALGGCERDGAGAGYVDHLDRAVRAVDIRLIAGGMYAREAEGEAVAFAERAFVVERHEGVADFGGGISFEHVGCHGFLFAGGDDACAAHGYGTVESEGHAAMLSGVEHGACLGRGGDELQRGGGGVVEGECAGVEHEGREIVGSAGGDGEVVVCSVLIIVVHIDGFVEIGIGEGTRNVGGGAVCGNRAALCGGEPALVVADVGHLVGGAGREFAPIDGGCFEGAVECEEREEEGKDFVHEISLLEDNDRTGVGAFCKDSARRVQ